MDSSFSFVPGRATILKFGGTSVEDAAAFERVARIVGAQQDQSPVVVVSAMSRVTDALLGSIQKAAQGKIGAAKRLLEDHWERHLEIGRRLRTQERDAVTSVLQKARHEICTLLASISNQPQHGPALQDAVVSWGEWMSALLLTAVLREHELEAEFVDARGCIITNNDHGCATPLAKETTANTRRRLGSVLKDSRIPVLGGFVGATESGVTTTLGRGGSDYTAALVGAALSAREIQIWTDVSGVLTADPRVVENAQTILCLSYPEAAELAYFGAKVLHPKTIQPAVEHQIPIRICNSKDPAHPGTRVCVDGEGVSRGVKSIAHKRGITIVQVSSAGMLGAHGFLRALFEVFDRHRTAVDIVTTSEVSVSLSLDNTSALRSIVKDLEPLGTVEVETGRAIVCVVGKGLRQTPGIAAQLFSTIRDVNISLISQGASRINLTFVVDESNVEEVVRRLHRTFFEGARQLPGSSKPEPWNEGL